MRVWIVICLMLWVVPVATRGATAQGTPIASPIASPVASPVAKCNSDLLAMTVDATDLPIPVASPGPTATPMLQASAGEATAVTRPIRNLLKCASLGTPDALKLLRSILPEGPVPAWLLDLRDSAAIDVVSIGNIRGHGSGYSIAEVAWRVGLSERLEEWTLYRDDVSWQIRSISPLPTFLIYAAAGMDVRLDPDGLVSARTAIDNPGRIILRLHNASDRLITSAALLFPVDGAADPSTEAAPSGSSYAGDVALGPGEEADLTIVSIPTGETRLMVIAWWADPTGALQQRQILITVTTV